MPDPNYAEMLDLAARLAVEAGAIIAQAERTHLHRKGDGSVVTDADRMVQDHILGAIATHFPDHAVCAEETLSGSPSHGRLGEARYAWVVDPVDGTRNYACGFPCYSTSIAVLDGGHPVVAAVREHNTGRLYTAALGAGATCDGQRLPLQPPVTFDDMLVGFASSKDRLAVEVVRRWAELPGVVLRNTGSTAAHLAWVAAGHLSAAFAKRVMLWDVAAGALLIHEAGGVITDPAGRDYLPFHFDRPASAEFPYLAGLPRAHARLLPTIQRYV